MNKCSELSILLYCFFIFFDVCSQTNLKNKKDSIQIVEVLTRRGLTFKNVQDSLWNLSKPINISSVPTLIRIKVKTKKPNTKLLCFLSETLKMYDTLNLDNTNSINLFNLTGGSYKLIFFEANNTQNRATIEFSIETDFYEKWWFMPLLLLSLSAILGIIFYFLSLIRLRLQSVRHELEIKALRAQMNPHFIFNCMNTIDAYILRKKFLEASDYLQKFSKLIRKILENSESQTISIKQEIQTLKLYVELEQERFSHSFVSYFDIEPELMTNDYQIPSLVLQPFVENAILHGIRHLTGREGLVSVILKKIKNESGEDILFCQIQDNGIGRKASSIINQQRQASHKSMGVNVTLERIHTYQAIYGNKMETIVSDLEEGTQIEIKLPLFMN